jgi:hypothetical protein
MSAKLCFYLTEREFSQVETLTHELACQRCRADRDFLRGLVRAYVGPADAAGGAVLARCDADPAYLASIVHSYIAFLDERGLLGFLHSIAETSAVVKRLGFDPFDDRRREAYRLAHSFFNTPNQIPVLAVGPVVLFLMCLFPPWQIERRAALRDPCYACLCEKGEVMEVRFAGYHFINAPPSRGRENFATKPPGRFMAGSPPALSQGDYITYRLYWELLLQQVLGLLVLIVATSVALRDRRSFEERLLALQAVPHEGRKNEPTQRTKV